MATSDQAACGHPRFPATAAMCRRVAGQLALAAAALPLLTMAGCGEEKTGPIAVSAIGKPPELVNPNLNDLDPPSAFLLDAVAQGLVRFDIGGQIEPALAQRWIVSDDGLRYTFRLEDTEWTGDGEVTAEQASARLRAAVSRASRNPLKPLLGVIDDVQAMTEDVFEISLSAPRTDFLQLLAQPQMAIVADGRGTGPYRIGAHLRDGLLLRLPHAEEDEFDDAPPRPDLLLRGERAALAVARFEAEEADFVTGGTAGDLLFARAASLPSNALRFDPVFGLFGLAFLKDSGALGEESVRQALSMALDRAALVTSLEVPDLQPRETLLPPGLDDLAQPPAPGWSALPPDQRRAVATRTIAAETDGKPLRVKVALPPGPGYRMLFALIRRDWRQIGVEAEAAGPGEGADLRLVDAVAPAGSASWYLRRFGCGESPVCSAEADELLRQARSAESPAERLALLAQADRTMEEAALFVPIAAPVRWHLVSSRLTGFRTNPFGRHPPSTLLADQR